MADTPTPSGDNLVSWLDTLPVVAGVRPVDRIPRSARTPAQRPAYRRQQPPDKQLVYVPQQQIVSLVREAGVLRWRSGATSTMLGRSRAGRAALPVGEVVKQYAFERLESSSVHTALTALDRKLTPAAAYAAKATVSGGCGTARSSPSRMAAKRLGRRCC